MGEEEGKFYLTITGPIQDAPIAQLIQLVDSTIRQESITHLYISINTPGGSVNAGVTFYHYLRSLPIKITTHNIGQVDSIGNVIFLAGEERIASPATSFLLHGVSVGLQGPTQISRSQLDEIASQIKQDEARIETITVERTGKKLTEEKLADFFRTGNSLGPAEARKYGIVTAIQELKIPDGAKKGIVNTFPIPNQGNVPNV